MEPLVNLRDLLQHEVDDLYSAEEQIIEALPKMSEKATDRELKKALNEHADIKAQIETIIASKNVEPLQFKMLADAVDNHVRYEERELFPHLENMLTEEQLKEIGNKLQTAANDVCNDEFTDEFWKGGEL